MSLKPIPIVLLILLVVGVVACQPKTENNEEKVAVAEPHTDSAEAEPAGHVDSESEGEHLDSDRDNEHIESDIPEEHEDSDSDNEHAKSDNDGEHIGSDRDGERNDAEREAVPEFVPPSPIEIDVSSQAVAFAIGDPDAPVQIVEFTDYQCPFCNRHASETVPTIIENMVEEGRVFYAIKDLPLDNIHPEARMASVAARCAGEQDAYLRMRNVIFALQGEWSGTGDDAGALFAEAAGGLDLDLEAYDSCVSSGNQEENVQANMEEAFSIGVSSTPFSFINGYAISGAQPYEVFEIAVELAENGELDDVVEAQARQAYEEMLAQQDVVAQQPPPPAPEPIAVALDDAFAIGDLDAPVTIVEYTDYQCPFCARHALQTFGQISEELVATGQVRYIFKDLPLTNIHPQATLAAEAARCAGAQDQEAFVTMHDTLFEHQGAWSGQADAGEIFTAYASEMGLNQDDFAACLENHEFESAVLADFQEAQALGITGTPAFLINGQPLMGAQPYEIFAQAVESIIAAETGNTASS